MVNTIAQKVNFTYVIVPAADNKFGNKNPDGKWNGMIGMLVSFVCLNLRLVKVILVFVCLAILTLKLLIRRQDNDEFNVTLAKNEDLFRYLAKL